MYHVCSIFPLQYSALQEAELVRLAWSIDPIYYDVIGTHLGVRFAELNRIRVDHPADVRGALTEVLMTWNTREEGGNKREILAGKLKEAELTFVLSVAD